jgi:catechol 2,3-dioxygenase-like lactoylglutathione lyase family enzyme
MVRQSSDPSRREFLSWTTSALVAAHFCWLEGAGTGGSALVSEEAIRIRSLDLLTSAPLASMRQFYNGTLGLRVLDEKPGQLTIAGGSTRLTFRPAEDRHGKPFYHFAFNIPENKILPALAWQKARSPLMPIPARLRDPQLPDEIVDFRHWNAHSIFFFDPGGNVVEYIARHDLKNARPGAFGPGDILHASEIAFVVDDVKEASAGLKPVAGVEQYRGADDQFVALGDEMGLLLVMKRGRVLNFDPSSTEKAAAVFPTTASIAGPQPSKYEWPGFPYLLSIT